MQALNFLCSSPTFPHEPGFPARQSVPCWLSAPEGAQHHSSVLFSAGFGVPGSSVHQDAWQEAWMIWSVHYFLLCVVPQGWLWKKSVLPLPALQRQWSNSVARVLIPFHRYWRNETFYIATGVRGNFKQELTFIFIQMSKKFTQGDDSFQIHTFMFSEFLFYLLVPFRIGFCLDELYTLFYTLYRWKLLVFWL